MSRLITRFALIGIIAASAGCSTFTGTKVRDTSKTFATVVVDAGHGGKDNGAFRRNGPPEKAVALDVAQRLDRKLRDSRIRTVMTRDSDVFIPLDERVAIENAQKNAVFVSIHFNDSRRRVVRGFETYYHSAASFDLANQIQAKLMTIPNSANRGVHIANYRVLRKATIPAVLVECGYLSNRSEANQAGDSEYRELLADRIAQAIVEQRYGSVASHGSTQVAVQSSSNSEPSSSNLVPGAAQH